MNTISEPNVNYPTGYIKLYRSLRYKGWYKKSDYIHLWVHLLLKANHKENEWLYKNQTYKINPGQFITSRRTLSEETGINESKIERILSCFENEQQIEQQNLHVNRLITITYWSEYQKSEQQFEQQMNSERTASEQRVNTNKNDKNDKNDKKKDKISDKNYKTIFDEVSEEFELSDDLKQIFLVWFKYKAEKKQSYQPTGMRTLIKTKLLETSGNPEKLKDMVLFSISNNYQGLFQRTNNNGNGKSKSTDEGIAAIAKQYFPEEV